jgi:hypothetical protein
MGKVIATLFIGLIVFIFLKVILLSNNWVITQLSEWMQVKPHHAAHKLNMGLNLLVILGMFVWGIVLTISTLKKKKKNTDTP